jgi:hypothetical protein
MTAKPELINKANPDWEDMFKSLDLLDSESIPDRSRAHGSE